MRSTDIAIALAIGLIWGANFAITKLALSGWPGFDGAPPFFFAGLRFAAGALILAPLLRPLPDNFGDVAMVALLMGAVHFGLLFSGLALAPASSVAVVMQMVVPFTMVLSVLILGERVGWRRGLGAAAAFLGVTFVVFDPDTFTISLGLLFVVAATGAIALGSIAIKRLGPMGPMRMQAWTGLLSAPPLFVVSAFLEQGQTEALQAGGWGFYAALAYVVIMASLLGQGGFYLLMRRHDASLIAPLMLFAPLWGVVSGVAVLGEPFSWRLIVGGAVTIGGALAIVTPANMARRLFASRSNVEQDPTHARH